MEQEIPQGSIIITPQQVYDKVNLLTDAITNLVQQDTTDRHERENLRIEVTKLRIDVHTKCMRQWQARLYLRL